MVEIFLKGWTFMDKFYEEKNKINVGNLKVLKRQIKTFDF